MNNLIFSVIILLNSRQRKILAWVTEQAVITELLVWDWIAGIDLDINFLPDLIFSMRKLFETAYNKMFIANQGNNIFMNGPKQIHKLILYSPPVHSLSYCLIIKLFNVFRYSKTVLNHCRQEVPPWFRLDLDLVHLLW